LIGTYTDVQSVTNYSTKTAILTLEHNHPPGNKLKALVDITLLVNTLKSSETRIGEWVNVIGYTQVPQQRRANYTNSDELHVQVQAIVLWPSGPLKLDGYERSLDQQKADQDQEIICRAR
jgi:hypothetical protein